MLVWQCRAEDLVVDPEVLAVDACLRNTGRATGLEHEDRLSCDPLGHPPLHRTTAKPFVLEEIELLQVLEARDALPRIPIELLRVIEPERAAGCRIEMPRDDLAHPRVEGVLRSVNLCGRRHRERRGLGSLHTTRSIVLARAPKKMAGSTLW